MNLRPYQQRIVEGIEHGWKQFRRQLVVVPTGGGKTIIFAHLTARRQDRSLILAHREELIDQAVAKLRSATGIEADKEKAEHQATLSARVVVGSVQSLQGARLASWPADHFGLVVCDEAHHAVSKTWQNVLQHFSSAQVLGVTATPDRGDKRNLGEFFEAIPQGGEVSLFELVNDSFLTPITVHSVPLKLDLNGVRTERGDFKDSDLGDALEPYLGQIAEAIRSYASFRRTLAFLPLIHTSKKFVEACNNAGLRAAHVDGLSKDRADKLAAFARFDFDVLSNAMLLTEGYDDPGIECVCILRPTKSRALYSQMVGRGTRPEPLKKNLLLLDFLWMHETHAIVRPAHLIAKTQQEADAITKAAQEKQAGGKQGELDLQGLASEVAAEREAALAKKLAQLKDRKGKFISAEEFAVQHHNTDLADYEPVWGWEKDQVSERQAKYLKQAGIDLGTVKSKGHASQLLDIYFGSKKLELATPGQRAFLRKHGHPSPDTATAAEARQFFADKRKAA